MLTIPERCERCAIWLSETEQGTLCADCIREEADAPHLQQSRASTEHRITEMDASGLRRTESSDR